MEDYRYRQEAYRRGEKQSRRERETTNSLKQGIEHWLKGKVSGQWIYPLTLEFKNGPHLYGDGETTDFSQLEREIGVFIERLYRFGVKKKVGAGWAYLGWPDKGGTRSFIHYHGFLMVGTGHWMDAEFDFKSWFEGIKERLYGHEPQAVAYAHIAAEIQTLDSIKTFNGYAAKWGVVEPVWYQANVRNTGAHVWEETVRGQVWKSGDFAIHRGRRRGFRVLKADVDMGRANTLHSAKCLCEARTQ